MLGVGLKFIIAILQFGAVILLIAAVVWASVQLFKVVVIWIAPALGRDGKEILSTMRSWLPSLSKRKKTRTRRMK